MKTTIFDSILICERRINSDPTNILKVSIGKTDLHVAVCLLRKGYPMNTIIDEVYQAGEQDLSEVPEYEPTYSIREDLRELILESIKKSEADQNADLWKSHEHSVKIEELCQRIEGRKYESI